VIYRLPTMVSTTHLGVSLIFFIYLIWLTFRLREGDARPLLVPAGIRRWTLGAGILVYLQCLVGALMRHLGAGLACVDLPLCRGRVWPSGEHPSVLLHAGHRLIAVAAGIVVIGVAVAAFRAARGRPGMRALAVALGLVVLVQIGLGAASILTFLDALPVTAHLGGAAALLAGLSCLLWSTRAADGTAEVVA
jgi:heme A synthase